MKFSKYILVSHNIPLQACSVTTVACSSRPAKRWPGLPWVPEGVCPTDMWWWKVHWIHLLVLLFLMPALELKYFFGLFFCIQVDWEGWAIYSIQIAFMHEEIFKKSVHSLSDIINTWTGCPLKTAVMFLTKTNALIVHSVMYFLKAKFFIVGIWIGHRIRHAELYLLAENWLLLLTNLLFNDSVSMVFFIVMNTGLLIRWSDKCAVCVENYAGLKVVLWNIKKGKEPIKCWHLKEKGPGNAEGTTLCSSSVCRYLAKIPS